MLLSFRHCAKIKKKKSKELKNDNYIYHNFINLVYVCYGLQGGEEEAGDGDEKDEQTA